MTRRKRILTREQLQHIERNCRLLAELRGEYVAPVKASTMMEMAQMLLSIHEAMDRNIDKSGDCETCGEIAFWLHIRDIIGRADGCITSRRC